MLSDERHERPLRASHESMHRHADAMATTFWTKCLRDSSSDMYVGHTICSFCMFDAAGCMRIQACLMHLCMLVATSYMSVDVSVHACHIMTWAAFAGAPSCNFHKFTAWIE